jgi:pimeloyl-ACP methyl ester carboxylesterase
MAAYREGHVTSQDGLKLYFRDYGERTAHAAPVICLPGLTRTARDFEGLAAHLSKTRRVLCFDLRGRGRSDYDPDFRNYNPAIEASDVLAQMAALNAPEGVIVGTSRGGLVATVLAALRPTALKAVILNDVGPELDPRGVARIAGYVGQMKEPETWADAVTAMKTVNGSLFDLSEAEWEAVARRSFRDEAGRPRMDYDPKIGDATRAQMAAPPAFDPWTIFNAFGPIKTLLVRGANSDLIAPGTVVKMKAAKPDLESVEVPGRGHAPFLDEPVALAAIDDFLARHG